MRSCIVLLSFGLTAGCSEYNTRASGANDPGTTWTGTAPPTTEQIPLGWGRDAWDLAEVTTIDVIFYGDTSTSMTEELVTMGQNVTKFMDRLSANVPEWQLGVITGNTGCAVKGVLTPDMSDAPAKFAEAIITPTGNVDEDEMGFQNVARGIEKSGAGDCNDGLIRGGPLNIVFVSDENDESPGFNGAVDYWADYVDDMAAVHGNIDDIYVSAVTGPIPNGCNGADPGHGYAEAVDGTGGEMLSICGDWPNQLEVLADVGTIGNVYELSEVPVESSLQVWVNTELVDPGTWMYDRGRNAVVFLANPPEAGDRVDILYDVAE